MPWQNCRSRYGNVLPFWKVAKNSLAFANATAWGPQVQESNEAGAGEQVSGVSGVAQFSCYGEC